MTPESTPEAFRKTDKGAEELRSRRHGLSPRLRQLLILIDGKRDRSELARILPGPDLAEHLAQLERDGFVSRSGGTDTDGEVPRETPSEAGPRPAAAPATPDAAPADASAPIAAADSIEALRTRIVRALIDTIGPHGDDLAIRIERAQSVDELRTLVPAALSLVEAFGGRAAIDRFLQRCGAV